MNNSDMPAMPQTWVPDYGNKPPVTAAGLTKREHFAAMAMQGIIGSGNLIGDPDKEALAIHSVEYADALLAALEQKQ